MNSNICRGLAKFLLFNRSIFNNRNLANTKYEVPVTPPVIINPTPSTIYTSSDFGENIINNHDSGNAWHSEYAQELFNYVTRNFRDRCTSYQSYKTPSLGNSLFGRGMMLKNASIVKADLVMTPYVDAALESEGEYYDFVLPVGSHYDNNGSDGIIDNDDRHDITPNANTFLINSVAVSARRDTPTEFKKSTSYGYGMEFFEDCSPEGLDIDFPDYDMPTAIAELASVDGITITSSVHPTFTTRLKVGDEITVRYSGNEADWMITTVTSINSANSISVSPAVDPISSGGIYAWINTTLGHHVYGQAESWATPIIAGKLKVIKMTTNKDWDTVRAAARATARRNPTGIPEIDNSNWDMYRGFGQINMQAAIDYINNL